MTTLADKTILVAPLDWGLGHATRCMPVIDKLLQKGAAVHLAGNGVSLDFLKDKYPQLPAHELRGYNIQYPIGKNASVQILLQSPRMFRTIDKENEAVQKIVAGHGINTIISDNRYGVWNKACRNIIICHQLALQSPAGFSWMNPFFLRAHFYMMRHFDKLWIPDESGKNNLSGKLSHGFQIPVPHRYIGILSRFSNLDLTAQDKKYHVVALLSGNEPQRTYFEALLKPQLKKLQTDTLLIQGKPGNNGCIPGDGIDIVPALQAEELLPILMHAEVVICRAGYSTIMDMAALGKKAILVPTPGQTEQEYLAEELKRKGMAVVCKQNELNIQQAMESLKNIEGFEAIKANPELLEQAIANDL